MTARFTGSQMTRGRRPRRRRSRAHRPLAEINVTPFVDVMLVLLVVFMITAPLLSVGVPVDLPRTEAANLTEDVEPLIVSVQADGSLHLQERPVTRAELIGLLDSRRLGREMGREDLRIYLRGDKALRYGAVMEVMGLLAARGFARVTLVAELPGAGAATAEACPEP